MSVTHDIDETHDPDLQSSQSVFIDRAEDRLRESRRLRRRRTRTLGKRNAR